MSRSIDRAIFHLGTHPAIGKQPLYRERPSGGQFVTIDQFSTWWYEMREIFKAFGSVGIDTGLLYQFLHPMSVLRIRDQLDLSGLEIWSKVNRIPVRKAPGDVDAEADQIRGGKESSIYAGGTDVFAGLFDREATRGQVFQHCELLGIRKFLGMAIHDPGDYWMREGGYFYEQDGKIFYKEEEFLRDFDFDSWPHWDRLAEGSISGLQACLGQNGQEGLIENIGIATKIAKPAIEIVKHNPGAIDYVMHTLCNPLLSRGLCDLINFALGEKDAGRPLTLDIGGILAGGLFAVDKARIQSDLNKPRAERVVFNYQNAGEEDLQRAGRLAEAIEPHGISMLQLAAEFAGQMLEHLPDLCGRCVLTSNTPKKTADLVEMICTRSIDATVWQELIAAGHIDPRCEIFLCP